MVVIGFIMWAIIILAIVGWVGNRKDEKTRQREVVTTQVACPTCHRRTVEPITLGQRAASGVAGGIVFSQKARANFKCNTCGYVW